MGVLVAISIPIFTAQLEKAREATDEANIRSAYAECSASVLTGVSSSTDVTVTNTGGVITATKSVTLKQQKAGWEGGTNPEIAGVTVDAMGPGTCVITVKDDGTAPSFAYTAS